jgi:hypothetical protein
MLVFQYMNKLKNRFVEWVPQIKSLNLVSEQTNVTIFALYLSCIV